MNNDDKQLEAQREATVDQLIMNYGHGKLPRDVLEQRLDAALDAPDFVTLQGLTNDLELHVDEEFLARKRWDLETETDASTAAGDVHYVVTVCGHNSRRGHWQPGREIRVISLCGGVTLDFREAEFTTSRVRVRMLCVCGGVRLLVPEGVNVTSKTFCLCGGFDNRAANIKGATRPTIEVEGLVLCGGGGAYSKMSRRERLLHFASALKERSGKGRSSPRSGASLHVIKSRRSRH